MTKFHEMLRQKSRNVTFIEISQLLGVLCRPKCITSRYAKDPYGAGILKSTKMVTTSLFLTHFYGDLPLKPWKIDLGS